MPPPRSPFLRRILTGGAALGAAWWCHSHWIAPLQRCEAESQRSLGEARLRLSDAREQIRKTGEQAPEAARVRASLEALHSDIPSEPTAVWLPVRIEKHLQSGGIAGAVIRMNSKSPEPGVAGYERSFWNLNVPRQDTMKNLDDVLLKLADIESKEPFVRILDLSFHSEAEHQHSPAGGVNVTALIPR